MTMEFHFNRMEFWGSAENLGNIKESVKKTGLIRYNNIGKDSESTESLICAATTIKKKKVIYGKALELRKISKEIFGDSGNFKKRN